MPAHSNSALYRPDIDGLRAIAVLSVVGYHAFPYWFPGGFVGVDVFFVISGFLISRIILGDLTEGRFSIREFYLRRIRRIFPSLLVVLTFCLLFGWLTLLVDEYRQLGKYVVGGAGFAGNLVALRDSGYFDHAAETKPLLHLWSLGIEEQFYLVWPLLLSLLWLSGRFMISLVTSIALASFGFGVTLIATDAVTAFYSPFSRFWELLAGCFLAYSMYSRNNCTLKVPWFVAAMPDRYRSVPGWLSRYGVIGDLQSLVGILFVAVGIFGLDQRVVFPGWQSLFPTVGALLIISGGTGPDARINRRLLSSPKIVFLGLISYPLYLWHWPLLAFTNIIYSRHRFLETSIVVVLFSIVLAWLTYRFVEKPLRFGRYGAANVIILGLLMIVFGLFGYFVWNGTIVPHSASFSADKIIRAAGDWAYPGPRLSNFRVFDFKGRQFLSAAGAHGEQTLYIGDSNMEQYRPRLNELAGAFPGTVRSAVFATAAGCPPIPGVIVKNSTICNGFIESALGYAENGDVKSVVVAAQWFSYFSGQAYFFEEQGFSGALGVDAVAADKAYESLETMLSALSRSGKQLYLVLNTPIGAELDPKNMVERTFFPLGFRLNFSNIFKSDLLNRYGGIHRRLSELGARAGAKVIDPLDYLCAENICPSQTEDQEPIYKDAVHIRPFYVRSNIRYLDQTILLQRQ